MIIDCLESSLYLNELHLELGVDALVFDSRHEHDVGVFLHRLALLQHIETSLDQTVRVVELLDEHPVARSAEYARIGCSC